MSVAWACYEIESRPPGSSEWITVVHVVPTYGPEHEFSGDECWCEPTSERHDNGNYVVVHREMN